MNYSNVNIGTPEEILSCLNVMNLNAIMFKLAEKAPEAFGVDKERLLEMFIENSVLRKHTAKISQLNGNGPWFTRFNGKKIQRNSRRELIEVLYKLYYGCDPAYQDPTIASVFDDFMTIRKMEVADTTWAKDLRHYNDYISQSALANIPLAMLKYHDAYSFQK